MPRDPRYDLGDVVTLQTGTRATQYRIEQRQVDPDFEEGARYRLARVDTGRLSEGYVSEWLIMRGELAAQAQAACAARGHDMPILEWDVRVHTCLGHVIREQHIGYAECRKCGAWVQVDTYPEANGIDIGGSAVATSCGKGAVI